ncbi:MAG: hypothetical protein RLZZ210_1063 [Pseudomonadota bacterium]|jgi:hypothetical protein
MQKRFYAIMAAEFFSLLADNTVFMASMSILYSIHAPKWIIESQLKLFFILLAYVVFSALVGAIANTLLKSRVMVVTNIIKVLVCSLIIFGINPLIIYGIVGLKSDTFYPAKYGILKELLPPKVASRWIKGLTVGAIILSAVLVTFLNLPNYSPNLKLTHNYIITILIGLYLLATSINFFIPKTSTVYSKQDKDKN